MSDYYGSDDEDNFSYAHSEDEEQEVIGNDDEDYLNRPENLVNGHDADEEDVDMDRADNELYGGTNDNPENEHDEIESDDEEPEITIEEKTTDKIVPKSERKSIPYMTKFEYSYLVSQRALAIGNDSPLMYPETKFIHAIDIAKEETAMGLNPIIIRRVLPNGMIEEWKCNELKLLDHY